MRVLVKRVQDGDTAAFAEIYRQYQPSIHAYLARRVAPQDAADLVSETFARALSGLSRGQFVWRGRDLGAWLVAIAHNRLINHYQSCRQRREVITDDPATGRVDLDANEPEAAALASETAALNARAVREALAQLTADQRQVIELRFVHEQSPAQIALRMGRSPGAVRGLQRRALSALVDALPPGVTS